MEKTERMPPPAMPQSPGQHSPVRAVKGSPMQGSPAYTPPPRAPDSLQTRLESQLPARNRLNELVLSGSSLGRGHEQAQPGGGGGSQRRRPSPGPWQRLQLRAKGQAGRGNLQKAPGISNCLSSQDV